MPCYKPKKQCQGCGIEISVKNWSRHIKDVHNDISQQFVVVECGALNILSWFMISASFIGVCLLCFLHFDYQDKTENPLLQEIIDNSIDNYLDTLVEVTRSAYVTQGCNFPTDSFTILRERDIKVKFVREKEQHGQNAVHDLAKQLSRMSKYFETESQIIISDCQQSDKCTCGDLEAQIQQAATKVFHRGDWSIAWNHLRPFHYNK